MIISTMLRYIHGEWKYPRIDGKHNVKETYKLFSIEGRENGSLYFLNFYKQIALLPMEMDPRSIFHFLETRNLLPSLPG